MKLTLGQAARQSGFSKPTLSRAIKSGALSATRLDDSSYAVDPTELQRWIDNNGHRNSYQTRLATASETPETPFDNSVLQAEVAKLRELLTAMSAERDRERSQLSDQIGDLRRRLDASEDERRKAAEETRRLTLLLTDQTARPAVPVATERPRGFFRWFARSA